jgi:hypothetical protein
MPSFPIGLPAAMLYRLLSVFLTCGQFPTGHVPLTKLPHPRFPQQQEKPLGPIAAFTGKLDWFGLPANHEKKFCPDTRRGASSLCAVRICLP